MRENMSTQTEPLSFSETQAARQHSILTQDWEPGSPNDLLKRYVRALERNAIANRLRHVVGERPIHYSER